MSKVSIKNVDKIFGPNPKSVIKHIKNGMSKIEILEKTNHTVGVYDVSVDIEEGEFFVIMGLSGSGKSTLVRCLNRLIEPTSGSILIDGEDITKANHKKLNDIRRKKISMVFQKFGLLPHRTILSNVAFGLEIQEVDKVKAEAKAKECVEVVGLKGYEDKYPSELSGGMQQRVGLARALTNDPDVILMDEAFSALDPLIRKQMQDEILDLQDKMQKTIIFITHDLDEALKLGDRIMIMKDGAVVQIGTPEEILMNPANLYVEEFVKEVNRAKVITAGSIVKKPYDFVQTKHGVRVAIRKMEENDKTNIIVLDKHKNYLGVIFLDEAIKAVKSGSDNINDVIKKDELHCVAPDEYINELLPYAADSEHYIVVLEDNKFMGVITRATLIRELY